MLLYLMEMYTRSPVHASLDLNMQNLLLALNPHLE
jgi:hypothetical protein|uniref:Uncharacterized protein n=1 Tax=Picea glauca TaxID=3330 RepID=A0A101M1E9_PICGL|nr:hypothetical protein ABT39_MTgene3748 [Picea glauca]